MVFSREIKLDLSALRQDAEVVPEPRLGLDGADLAAVIGLWRGSDPERAEHLHDFVRRCLPEVKHILVRPSPTPAYQRLWVQQDNNEQFDAEHLSDGVLCFIALAMHAIDAAPGSLLFIEEPEQSIHPRRLGDLVDLFRQIVDERKCQVVLATHSAALLNHFRDEPEAIVLFRRGENGTRVNSLTKFPDLMAALEKRAEPGEMLVDGFLNEPS
jgi:predicted ATPase